ncbi:hypothetical protein ACB092_11G218500 [Castanea dentata]
MMISLRFYLCFLVLHASINIQTTQCHGEICLPNNHVALFIFGDSEVDAGNNNYINTTTDFQANYSPYGESFFSISAAEYAKLTLLLPYLQPGYKRYIDGANFASTGAGVLDETRKGLVISLNTQLNYFNKVETLLRHELGKKEAKALVAKAVCFFSIGSIDYFVPFTTNPSLLQTYSDEEYVNMVIGNLTTVIKVITTLQPGNTGACIDGLTTIVKLHNKALFEVLPNLEREHKGFKYSIADFYSFLIERINNPSKYGFKEGKIACCGTGPYRGISSCGGKRSVKEYELCAKVSDYVFFDSAHFSEKVYQQFAELLWSGTPNITRPYNVKSLFEHWCF